MTRISQKEARQLGIIPGPAPKRKAPKTKNPIRVSGAQWDAGPFSGGCWVQIPFVPPSLNEWKNWHWAKQANYKKDLADAIRLLKLAVRLPRYERATVQVVYYHRTHRRRDKVDNWAPKFLMDALVAGGLLVDDNDDLVDVSLKMDFDPERPRVEVFLWPEKIINKG